MSMRIGALEAGGTKMVCAIATPEGEILEEESFPTTTPEETVPQLVSFFSEKGADALGIGAFGPTGVNRGLPTYGHILDTPKVAWRGYDLLGAFERGLGIPVGYDTDVNVACLGEVSYGCCRGLANVVYLTVGTGIGAGVYLDGRLLHGMLHPEAGHIPVTRRSDDTGACVCPYHPSCLEGLASGPAIERRWGAPAVQLADRPEVWDLEAHYLSEALCTYVMCYSPQRIVLGGGVMHQAQLYDLVREKLVGAIAGYLRTPELEDMGSFVRASALHDEQGVLGCVELGKEALAARGSQACP